MLHTTMRFALIAVIALSVPAVPARADEWVTPATRTFTSPNHKLEATITPAPDGNANASAAIGEPGHSGKPFPMINRWMPVDALLFDDGSLLALDNWHTLGYDAVATLYERDGTVRWSKTLAELAGQAFVDRAPHSVSSIWWRKTPLESTLAKDGKTVLVTLFDENQLQIRLRDGNATIVTVANLPDDPQRLYNRAHALIDEGNDPAALPLLERAMAKDPDFLEPLLLFIQALQRANAHQRVAEVVDHASQRWTVPAKDAYGIANVCDAWATSLEALGRYADAERVLRLAIRSAPTYTNPPIELATLLVGQHRAADADTVLDDFVGRLTQAPSLDTYAIAEVGGFYRRQGELPKALAEYLRAYRKDSVTNQFLYADLAALYEQIGNDAEAIRITEQLIRHFDSMGPAFAKYGKDARAELARLRAKRKHP